MRRLPLAIALPFLLAACGGGAKEEQATVAVDSTAMALEQFTPEMFDTITWSGDTAQLSRGEIVWNFSCKKCHGQLGHGDGDGVKEMAELGDTIAPPDFAKQWRFGTDREAALRAVYGGSQKGMPHWGISGLRARDVDAVTAFVTRNLVGLNPMTIQTSK